MNDAHMGHGHHNGHQHGPNDNAHSHGSMCSMNMLFTWDTTNLCIVFRQWHIGSPASLVASLVAVVLLAMGYEAMRSVSRQYEAAMNRRLATLPSYASVTESARFVKWPGQSQGPASQRAHLVKASLYGLQNFYAFMLMLVFMTYNGWVMLSVSLGALLGYLVFGQDVSSTKENACH
ncbi:hypothetical protein CDD82_1952 [Ophiocordyceps australis]|uniref:Copper transport protein n=1 Tax=Ophiocordyceps australis TaxID=1399860 RepID=A0A2C5Y5E4_9HYPO|nr:hypothetical protein CDD82_1952 [Ophiocordyceps australis]